MGITYLWGGGAIINKNPIGFQIPPYCGCTNLHKKKNSIGNVATILYIKISSVKCNDIHKCCPHSQQKENDRYEEQFDVSLG